MKTKLITTIIIMLFLTSIATVATPVRANGVTIDGVRSPGEWEPYLLGTSVTTWQGGMSVDVFGFVDATYLYAAYDADTTQPGWPIAVTLGIGANLYYKTPQSISWPDPGYTIIGIYDGFGQTDGVDWAWPYGYGEPNTIAEWAAIGIVYPNYPPLPSLTDFIEIKIPLSILTYAGTDGVIRLSGQYWQYDWATPFFVYLPVSYPTGYSLGFTGTGFAELSCQQSHSPNAAVKMGTVVDSDKGEIVFAGGPALGSINALSYWTYTVQAGTYNQLTAWVAIYLDDRPDRTLADWFTDYGAGSTHVEYIQAEPYYTYADHTGATNILPTMNMWWKWDAFDAAMPLQWESLGPGSPHNAPTLAQYIAGTEGASYQNNHVSYGPLYIVAIKIRMGYGGPWVNTLAYVDDVTINDYFEDFGVWNLQFDTSSTSIVAINTPATLKVHLSDQNNNPVQGQTVTFSSDPAGLTFTNVINPTDSSGLAQVTATTGTAGIYSVTATVCGAISDTWTLVVYDPKGMTAGGGWYYPLEDDDDPMPGTASFGFVAKYIKGSATGNLEFQYHVEDKLNLKSTTITWLMVSGSNAQFKGTATLNGESGYYFRVIAQDNGEPGVDKDTFAIKIWLGDPDSGGTLVHSSHNKLAGGNIIVRTK